MNTFQINIAEIPGMADAAFVDIRGAVDPYSSSALRNEIERARCRGVERFVIDLTHVPYVNSTGISYLLGLADEGTDERPSLVLAGVSPEVKVVLDMMKVTDFLVVRPGREEAIAVLRRSSAAV